MNPPPNSPNSPSSSLGGASLTYPVFISSWSRLETQEIYREGLREQKEIGYTSQLFPRPELDAAKADITRIQSSPRQQIDEQDKLAYYASLSHYFESRRLLPQPITGDRLPESSFRDWDSDDTVSEAHVEDLSLRGKLFISPDPCRQESSGYLTLHFQNSADFDFDSLDTTYRRVDHPDGGQIFFWLGSTIEKGIHSSSTADTQVEITAVTFDFSQQPQSESPRCRCIGSTYLELESVFKVAFFQCRSCGVYVSPERAQKQFLKSAMPPRKSNVSAVSVTGDESGATPATASASKDKKEEKDSITIEDLTMPRTMVTRLAKGVLLPNTQIQKDAITAFSKGATVFISYLSHSANAHTTTSGRRTISPADVLLALRETEFEFLLPRLEAEHARYQDMQTSKRNEYRKKLKTDKGSEAASEGKGKGKARESVDSSIDAEGGEASERASKRVRLDTEGDLDMGDEAARVGDDDAEEEEIEDEGGVGVDDADEEDEEAEEEEDEEEEEDPEIQSGADSADELEAVGTEAEKGNVEDSSQDEESD